MPLREGGTSVRGFYVCYVVKGLYLGTSDSRNILQCGMGGGETKNTMGEIRSWRELRDGCE